MRYLVCLLVGGSIALGGGIVLGSNEALAADFCVANSEQEITASNSDCASGGGVVAPTAAGLQGALDAAEGNPGSDRVLIGPHAFTGNFSYFGSSDKVEVIGAGQLNTVINAVSFAGGLYISGDSDSKVTDLSVRLNGDGATGLNLDSGADAERINVTTGPNAASYSFIPYGIRAWASSTLSNVDVRMPNMPGNHPRIGIAFAQCDQTKGFLNNATVSDTEIGVYVYGTKTNCGELVMKRVSVVKSNAIALELSADRPVKLSDSLLAPNPSGSAVFASPQEGGKTIPVDLQRVTIVGNAYGASNGAGITTNLAAADSNAVDISVVDSIIHGFDTALFRYSANNSVANINLIRSTYPSDPDGIYSFNQNGISGGSITPPGPSYLDLAPNFVDPAGGDFRLRHDSPLIDRGLDTTGQIVAHPFDLGGLLRGIDGNGDGTAKDDLGAFEYGHRSPTASATASQTSAAVGESINFFGSGSDPDPGDTLTYTWSFNGGTPIEGKNISKAFSVTGSHIAILTVTDSTGLTAQANIIVNIQIAPISSSTDGQNSSGPNGGSDGGNSSNSGSSSSNVAGNGRGTALSNRAPTSKIKRPAKAARRSGKLKVLRGTAKDDLAVKAVKLSIVKRVGKGKRARCLALKPNGRFERYRPVRKSCKPKYLLRARGTTTWRVVLKRALRSSVLTISSQAIDSGGQKEVRPTKTNRIKLRIR